MRTIKQLLELMLKHQERFETGLCLWVRMLFWLSLIKNDERKLLLDYIKENKPENAGYLFYWEEGEIAPRIEWINQEIKKL